MRVPRPGLRLFLVYAALTLLPIAVLGLVLARSFRADLDRRGLAEGASVARVITHGAVEPMLSGRSIAAGPTDAERVNLAQSFNRILTRGDALQLRLRDADGHVVFDPADPSRGPYGPRDDEVVEALEDEPVRLLTRLNADRVDRGSGLGPRAVEVYSPVRASDGTALGALEVYVPYAPIADTIDASYRHMLTILGVGLFTLWSVLAIVTWSVTRRIRRSAALTEELARTDGLTGLANRMALTEHLGARDDGADACVVTVLDLDGFGQINETLGQRNGDRFLTHVADVLRDAAGATAFAARLGADQFALVTPGGQHDRADRTLEDVRRALLDEFTLEDVAVTAEVTVGRATGEPGLDPAELVRRATVACRAAKRANVPLLDYEPGLEGFDADRLRVITDLRHGIADEQLVLHYQPKVDLRTGTVVGVEALVRWQHPQRGLLPPGVFVPAAESTALIIELTDWVLDEACRQAAAWHAEGRPLPIAVNVSARCLRDSAFADRVLATLTRHRLPTRLLSIEITETAVIADPTRAAATLRRLADRGIEIAIDDFGVGYTSLAHLEHLPVHELKIDRQFVAQVAAGTERATVVTAVVSLGHGLGLSVVAEGVEDDETLATLTTIGCDVAQGYGIARPAPLDQIEEWLAARAASGPEARVSPAG